MLKFKTFNFDLKFYWNWSFFHYEKIMRFKKWPQLPGAGRTRAGHHHGSHTPTSPEAILLGKMAHHTKQIRRECTKSDDCALVKNNLWQHSVATPYFTPLSNLISLKTSTFLGRILLLGSWSSWVYFFLFHMNMVFVVQQVLG